MKFIFNDYRKNKRTEKLVILILQKLRYDNVDIKDLCQKC